MNVSYEDKTTNVKFYFLNEDNFPLLFGKDGISEFDIFPRNLKAIYPNEIAN